MSIDAIKPGINPINPLQQPGITTGIEKADGEGGFSQMFQSAIKEVDKLQNNADTKIQDLVLKRDDTTTHDAMIALEKADVAFQLMNNIRAKIIRAYEDVMRTQV